MLKENLTEDEIRSACVRLTELRQSAYRAMQYLDATKPYYNKPNRLELADVELNVIQAHMQAIDANLGR